MNKDNINDDKIDPTLHATRCNGWLQIRTWPQQLAAGCDHYLAAGGLPNVEGHPWPTTGATYYYYN